MLCGSILPVLLTTLARAAEAKPDLSTPEKALAAFTKALDEGDPAKLDAVTTGDARQQEWIRALGGQARGVQGAGSVAGEEVRPRLRGD